MSAPRISIVLARTAAHAVSQTTLESLAQQDYPDVEVIEQEAATFGDAVDAGLARATGDILACLQAGDVLLEGALNRVATAMGAEARRHVVLGRSAFIVGGIAVPHPGEYEGRFDHLAIWKKRFDTVPRASLFWRRGVLDDIGRLGPGPAHAVDYALVCRVEKGHAIHCVDELWSASPLEDPPQLSDHERLEQCIAISRSHWGSWLAPLRWRCEASWRWYRTHPHEQARHHARQAEKAFAQGRRVAGLVEVVKTALRSPRMARGRFGR